MKPAQPFRRSSSDAVFGGVCGGLARTLGINAGIIRGLAVLLMFVTSGWILAAYIAGVVFIPADNRRSALDRRAAVRTPHQRANRNARLIPLLILLGIILATTLSNAQATIGILVAVGIFVFARLVGRRRQPARAGRPDLPQALAAWQTRLGEIEQQAQRPQLGYTLPSSLAEASQLSPQAQGFLYPAPSPLDLPAEPAWGATPAGGGAPLSTVARATAGPSPTAHSYQPAAPAVPGAVPPPAPLAAPAAAPLGVTASAPLGVTASAPLDVTSTAGPAPLAVASFLPAAAPAERPTAVAVKRRHPVAVGWAVLLLIAAGITGNVMVNGDNQLMERVTAVTAGVLGAGLVASPWSGRPRWLAPVAGGLLTVAAVTLLLLTLFHQL
jgi:phage shock protein PspC (stress-responsive transcriptional regulator)